jgi:hypothetical protein
MLGPHKSPKRQEGYAHQHRHPSDQHISKIPRKKSRDLKKLKGKSSGRLIERWRGKDRKNNALTTQSSAQNNFENNIYINNVGQGGVK